MKNFVYEGDATSHGGKVLSGSGSIKVKGRRAARVGDRVSCPLHGDNEIIEGSSRVKDGQIMLSRDGDHTRCGATLISSGCGARVSD
ncbi:PAAR domain-containing protein [Paraburkholderia sp. J10-1]|uniref:PAAR domain-containing protein n=1 Tax=Paraburkholderia sp. J10-1 TaxID=2805430 RepID=UPI002AB79A52|nr:PAAR domain-containing protein [Paraburkholderia sp. J10-1]